MGQERALPEGWKHVLLSEVTIPVSNIKPEDEPDREFGYVDISSIDNRHFRIVDCKRFTGAQAPSRARRPIQVRDVLFSNVRTYLRNIAMVPANLNAQLCSTGFTVLRANGAVEPEFLFRCLLTDQFIEAVTPEQTGTHYPATSDRVVLGRTIPLPPLAEQRRIVAKLEEALAQVYPTRKRLEKVPAILKRFRQSVLAAACSGRLTEGWREEHPEVEPASRLVEHIQELRSQKISRRNGSKRDLDMGAPSLEGEVPDRWCLTRIGSVADCLDSQRVPVNSDERKRRVGDVPYYGANGQVGWIDSPLFNEDLVLVVEDETFVGRQKPFSYVIRGKSWVNNHAHVLRPLGGISADYLNVCLAYYDFVPLTSGSTGRRKLTQAALVAAPLTIAPLPEQQEIVRRVEELFAWADAVERRVEGATARVEKLTQSVLAKAFRGELVPTEAELARREGREYEPASVLLERIRELKSEGGRRARGRQRSRPKIAPGV